MNNKTYSGWIIFLYLLIAFLFGVSVAVNFLPSRKSTLSSAQTNKLNEVMNYIDRYYVDSVNIDSIYDAAITLVLQGLDPHSAYATQAENKTMMESLEGAFEGVGVQFNIMNDTVMVVATIAGGPAEKAGVRAGDRIVSVDGKSIIGTTNEKVFKLLRGKKGTKVKVGVRRPGIKDTYAYEIIRDVIPTYTVDVAYMMDDHTGYIKLKEFANTTVEELQKALLQLRNKGMTSLILDLRGNAGGFLEAAIGVSDEFLPRNRKIVSVEGLKVRPEVFRATRKGNFESGRLVVLIDDFSASASEIVAGAVQDNDRGYIVGRRSFGKGLVQRQFELSDKSSIRLTTARYHTPSGRCIQRDYKDGIEAYYEEIYDRLARGEMENIDSIKQDTSIAYKTIGGRTVYGGGGIMPDHFVPLHQGHDLDGYYAVANTSALIQYAFNYTNEHKQDLKKQYPDIATFIAKATISDAQLNQLLAYYKKLSGKAAPTLSANSRKELKVWTKALIGRNLFGDDAFYPVINQTDETIIKARQVLKGKKQ
ncbi:MAG: S41 family peptidase [Bacteroidales bacterium]|nr:S41 family peptidase [Bacteroidales bacterium]